MKTKLCLKLTYTKPLLPAPERACTERVLSVYRHLQANLTLSHCPLHSAVPTCGVGIETGLQYISNIL